MIQMLVSMKEEQKILNMAELNQDKKNLIIGLGLIIFAFVCTILVLYFIISDNKKQVEEIGSLTQQVNVLSTENDLAQRKIDELNREMGTSIYLEHLLEAAHEVYGAEEASRREGFLWIDRNEQQLVITLGALNGLAAGSRLAIYDGDKKAGMVRVETAMDVISYVSPVNQEITAFPHDYYRVVYEEQGRGLQEF